LHGCEDITVVACGYERNIGCRWSCGAT